MPPRMPNFTIERSMCQPAQGASIVRSRRIRAVIFGTRNVLYDTTFWQRWVCQLLSHDGSKVKYPESFIAWEDEFVPRIAKGEIDESIAFQQFLEELGLSPAYAAEIDVATQQRRQVWDEQIHLFPRVVATLRCLRAGNTMLAAVPETHYTLNRLEVRLKELGVANCFDKAIPLKGPQESQSLGGVCKHLLESLSLDTSEVVFMASESTSLCSAGRMGITTVAYNWQTPVVADAHLFRFDRLPELIGSLSNPAYARSA